MMIFETTPPIVSMPSDSGVTSSSSISRRPLIEDVGLHGGAERDDFVRIEIAVRRAPEQLGDEPAHERHARRAADEHHFVDVARLETRVAERLRTGPSVRSTSGRISVSNSARVIARRYPASAAPAMRLDADLRLLDARRDPTSPESPPCESPGSIRVVRAIACDAHAIVRSTSSHQQAIDVVAAEMRVAVGRERLKDAILDLRIEMSKVPPPRS